MELTARVRVEAGSYWAEVEELPGCFAAGDTLDELFDSLREAVELVVGEAQGEGGGEGRSLRLTSVVLSDQPAVHA